MTSNPYRDVESRMLGDIYTSSAVMDNLEELKHQPTLLASFVLAAGVPLCL